MYVHNQKPHYTSYHQCHLIILLLLLLSLARCSTLFQSSLFCIRQPPVLLFHLCLGLPLNFLFDFLMFHTFLAFLIVGILTRYLNHLNRFSQFFWLMDFDPTYFSIHWLRSRPDSHSPEILLSIPISLALLCWYIFKWRWHCYLYNITCGQQKSLSK